MSATKKKSAGSVKIPLRMRLHAWWHGNNLEVRRHGQPGGDAEIKPTRKIKSLGKLEITQAVWGEGMNGPGEKEYILQFFKPLGLDPSMTVLDLGAGLGGPARLAVEHSGVWVHGLEADREIADRGMQLSGLAGLGKKAEITFANPESHVYRPNSVDCIYSKEYLYRLEQKGQVLEGLSAHLKDRGQLLFTDFVLSSAEKKAELADWIAAEPQKPHLWTVEKYESELQRAKLDVRIHEDISVTYGEMVKQAWQAMEASPLCKELDEASGAELLRQAEFWAKRVAAIESGALRVVRFYALKRSSVEID